jgi:hypothetical protein
MKNKLLNQDPKLHQTSEKLKHLVLVPIIWTSQPLIQTQLNTEWLKVVGRIIKLHTGGRFLLSESSQGPHSETQNDSKTYAKIDVFYTYE